MSARRGRMAASGPRLSRRNWVSNPRAVGGSTTGWTHLQSNGGVTSFSTATGMGSPNISPYDAFKVTADSIDAVNDSSGAYTDMTAAPGEVWSVGALMRVIDPGPASGVIARLGLEFRSAGAGLGIQTTGYSASSTTTTRLEINGYTAPALTTIARVYVQLVGTGASVAEAVEMRFTDVIAEKAATVGWFID